jgi:hypothetical protein
MEPANQNEASEEVATLGHVIQTDEEKTQEHLGVVVQSIRRPSFETGWMPKPSGYAVAERYERIEARQDIRAGLGEALQSHRREKDLARLLPR